MFLGILSFVILTYYFIKWIGNTSFKKEKKYNYYLELHKSKKENDRQYKEYLDYLAKNDPTAIPKEKKKSIDEIWWGAQIDTLVN